MSQSIHSAGKKRGPAKDVVLGHGEEYDGIEEYDNALPAWWLGLFYVSVVWGVCYLSWYHFIGHRSQAADYDAEVAAAELRWPQPKVEGVDLSAAAVAEGEKLYMTNCIACHGVDMKGGIGANLLDEVWIHGGEPDQILKTIDEGVGTKGMPAWGKVFGPAKVAQLAAFVYTKNQAAPREPAAPASADAPATEAPTDGAPTDGAKAGG